MCESEQWEEMRRILEILSFCCAAVSVKSDSRRYLFGALSWDLPSLFLALFVLYSDGSDYEVFLPVYCLGHILVFLSEIYPNISK